MTDAPNPQSPASVSAPKEDPVARAIVEARVRGQQPEAKAPIEAGEAPASAPAEEHKPNNSSQFSVLAKKEKALVQRQRELEAKEAEIDRLVEEKLNAKLADIKKLKPTERLKFVDTDYKSLTDMILNGEEPTTDMRLKDVEQTLKQQIDALQAKLDAKEKAAEQSVEQSRAKAVETFKSEIGSFISTNSGNYELTAMHDPEGAIVYSTIEDYYTQTGKVLDVKEAVELVDNYLAERVQESMKAKRFGKKEEPAPEAKADAPGFNAPKPSKSLSNITSSAPSYLSPKNEKERLQRAMAKLSGQ